MIAYILSYIYGIHVGNYHLFMAFMGCVESSSWKFGEHYDQNLTGMHMFSDGWRKKNQLERNCTWVQSKKQNSRVMRLKAKWLEKLNEGFGGPVKDVNVMPFLTWNGEAYTCTSMQEITRTTSENGNYQLQTIMQPCHEHDTNTNF